MYSLLFTFYACKQVNKTFLKGELKKVTYNNYFMEEKQGFIMVLQSNLGKQFGICWVK